MPDADEGERLAEDVDSGKLGPALPGHGSSTIAPVAKDVEVTELLAGFTPSSDVLPPPTPSFKPGVAVGRYQLVDLVGSGGMGSVYRAHDPHLSRDIALKVLHSHHAGDSSGSAYSHRLLREAQTLAKLSHPNVVAAFDVGTFEDVVFVTMELVPGESLRTWLTARHSVREVLRVLIAAGRGLVAAHTAGVLHRDFKPANVMVSPDGRVRVVDFGLARSTVASAESGAATAEHRVAELAAPAASLLERELTETGTLMGTPGYIAPEQLSGEPANALADQYSYAVTAFVALTRQDPRPGMVRVSAATGPSLVWPREVPRRVRRIVERGLAGQPSARHPSVAAMVDALEEAITPRRRTSALVALALGAMLIAGTTAVLKSRSGRVTCRVAPEAYHPVWGPERRATLNTALASTGRANADEAFGLLAGRLDAFLVDWLAMKQESCEATHVRGEQSERVLGLRNTCLDRKLGGADALVSAFSRSEPGLVDRAAGAMPDSLAECADTAALLGIADKLPAAPEARAAITRIESGLSVTRALTVAGHFKDATDSATKLLEEARAVGHNHTIAQALRLAAYAIYSQARTAEERKRGEAYLREAIPLAARAGDDRLVARTAGYLFELLAYGQGRAQEAEAMLPHVDALVTRAGDPPEERVELLFGQARLMSERRKYREAIELHDRVIALSPSLPDERKGYGAASQAGIGDIYLALENYPEAVRRMEAALQGMKAIFGSHHPRILISLANLALAQSKADSVAARATVLELRELAATLPAEDWRAITIPFLEGQIREDGSDCANALPFYREALERFAKNYGVDSVNAANVHTRLGACLLATAQRNEAISHYERTLSISRAKGSAPNVIAGAAFDLARALASGNRTRDRQRAVELAEQARDLWKQDDIADKAAEVEKWLLEQRAAKLPSRPRRSADE